MSGNTLLQLDLPGVSKVRSGKVREMFDLGDRLLMVASDRISAYDVVMPNGIPLKGEVLTMFSHLRRNQWSILVMSWISGTVMVPSWRACAMAKTLLSVGCDERSESHEDSC